MLPCSEDRVPCAHTQTLKSRHPPKHLRPDRQNKENYGRLKDRKVVEQPFRLKPSSQGSESYTTE
eukprot:5712447-Amphidinium_carterae.1